jgi:hypothetical protein
VISDPWLTEDLIALRPKGLDYLNRNDHKLQILMEFHSLKVPMGLMRLHESPVLRHPNMGYLVLIGIGRTGTTLATLLFQLARFDRVRFFETLDEGRDFLRQQVAKDLKRDQGYSSSRHTGLDKRPRD